jgi:hypothetical protein
VALRAVGEETVYEVGVTPQYLGRVSFQETIFIAVWNTFAMKSQLLCTIFDSYLQQILNNQATIMTFRSHIYKTINFDVIKVLLV